MSALAKQPGARVGAGPGAFLGAWHPDRGAFTGIPATRSVVRASYGLMGWSQRLAQRLAGLLLPL